MIHFFGDVTTKVFAVQTTAEISKQSSQKLQWLFGNTPQIKQSAIADFFIGPRAAMITPWSTNAVEITQNMGVESIIRIEEFVPSTETTSDFDPMLLQKFPLLDQTIFDVSATPEAIKDIHDIATYNESEGLALNKEEVAYLDTLAIKLGRKLTDSEVFGFSQANSEHCRHKIFNGTFIIDGEKMPSSLFKLIKETSKENPNEIVSAYKDNVAFVNGPVVTQFAPKSPDKPDYYQNKDFNSVISIKAETHNFPTTVEPFNGAATGSGGEIRDRLAGGKGSLPLAGSAVYMTSYSRLEKNRPWEQAMEERDWLYQTPLDILIKASNGASDFGNKFGQPLITGSVLTFEHEEHARKLGFDKVIMMAGGIGYGKAEQALKDTPQQGDQIVILGGENYRIGMGGAAVSSADTGAFSSGIELNAIQRSNPEMQKRAANAVRAMVESDINPIVSIHDHGAGGHLNCLSELVEDTGGIINIDALPVGDPTLSAKEIIGNESQERMGLVIGKKDLDTLQRVADRERSPMYRVGEVTADHQFTFESKTSGEKPMDFALSDMFGSSPETIMTDTTINREYTAASYDVSEIKKYTCEVLSLEAVGCKDWLTNKVDRCVTGKVAKQQCAGPLQLPLNNCGVMALDYNGIQGVATSIGHSPISGLIDPVAGSRNSITESLTNIIWAPLDKGLKSISLSANWMWPCNNPGEDARLYKAVEAISDFSIALGINVPTGKDSLSMKQKYKNEQVISPGTVIITAAGHCKDIKKVVEPVLQKDKGSIYYINISQDNFKLGGSSFGQVLNSVGNEAPTVKNASYVATVFNTIQGLIMEDQIVDSSKKRIKAAIIREKGSNSEREMANAMYLAGFDVKDVHMTDLISGRETLDDIKFIAAVGGFSNSDVLGSAKGWAGAFLYNEKANTALKKFFAKNDTLSLGVCNGCQLFIELGLLNPNDTEKPKMLHNDSGKFECNFTSVTIQENNSVMLSSLAGSTLGIWAAHGEGKFSFPKQESNYSIVGKYGYDTFPANPNGSDYNTAMMTDASGRHLVMMPHLERSTFPWNWGHYPKNTNDEVSPWLEAFVNARKWLETK